MIDPLLFAREICPLRSLSGLLLLACLSTGAVCASNIRGSVHNQTRSTPAAGDEVILVTIDGGLQEESRAKTDAQGGFALNVQYPGKSYAVRVIHQGVSYDQQASPGEALYIQVFDAAPRVPGVSGSIEILRAGMNGKHLHVSDLIEIKNDSRPPVTQAGERTFEVYLPANAKMDSVLAAGPDKISGNISAALVPGEPGHYTVNFPLRPGATGFAFNYDLPYDGRVAFQTRHAYPFRQLAVMVPASMKFWSRSSVFEILATDNSRYRIHVANHLKAGEGPEFEVSGTGTLPPIGDQSQSQARSQLPVAPNSTVADSSRRALALSPSTRSRLPVPSSSSETLVLGALTFFLLAASVFLIWRARKTQRAPVPPQDCLQSQNQ